MGKKVVAVSPPRDVIVIGAGIVGVCCASYLQRHGKKVTLIERDAPGEGCSLGNSGGFGIGLVAPLATPGLLLRLPRLLFDPRQPLVIAPGQLTKLLPWFTRFLAASRPKRVMEIASARSQLSTHAFAALNPLLEGAGAETLVRRDGMLFVYETRRSLERAGYSLEIARHFGVKFQEIDGNEVRELEPALGPNVQHGVRFPDNGHTTNPLRLTRALAHHFVTNGGSILTEHVNSIQMLDDGKPNVETNTGCHTSDAVVLAAGAWSGRIAASLNYNVPLAAERGYHAMIGSPGVSLQSPVTLSDRNVVLTPMEEGLRITGISEFGSLNAPPNEEHARRIAGQAQMFLPRLQISEMTQWMGPRPSTPDSLPFIGSVPNYPNIYFAFGHGHMGLAWAAITGKVIAEMICNQTPSLRCGAYRPNRFD